MTREFISWLIILLEILIAMYHQIFITESNNTKKEIYPIIVSHEKKTLFFECRARNIHE
jgi:hypothetical protein